MRECVCVYVAVTSLTNTVAHFAAGLNTPENRTRAHKQLTRRHTTTMRTCERLSPNISLVIYIKISTQTRAPKRSELLRRRHVQTSADVGAHSCTPVESVKGDRAAVDDYDDADDADRREMFFRFVAPQHDIYNTTYSIQNLEPKKSPLHRASVEFETNNVHYTECYVVGAANTSDRHYIIPQAKLGRRSALGVKEPRRASARSFVCDIVGRCRSSAAAATAVAECVRCLWSADWYVRNVCCWFGLRLIGIASLGEIYLMLCVRARICVWVCGCVCQ